MIGKGGRGLIKYDGSDLTNGIYFYMLQVYTPGLAGSGHPSSSSGQGFVETKKMILIKQNINPLGESPSCIPSVCKQDGRFFTSVLALLSSIYIVLLSSNFCEIIFL